MATDGNGADQSKSMQGIHQHIYDTRITSKGENNMPTKPKTLNRCANHGMPGYTVTPINEKQTEDYSRHKQLVTDSPTK